MYQIKYIHPVQQELFVKKLDGRRIFCCQLGGKSAVLAALDSNQATLLASTLTPLLAQGDRDSACSFEDMILLC